MSCYRARLFLTYRIFLSAAFMVLVASMAVHAQTGIPEAPANAVLTSTQPSLTSAQIVEEMLRHNQARADGLRHYQSTRTYQVEYKGYAAHIAARMVVEADYDAVNGK